VTKYQQSTQDLQWENFTGDNRDSRGWSFWVSTWLQQCLRITKPGGYILMFSDWRQLPTATDAIQSGGWVWRGICPWNKGPSARAPHKGYFRHQCEYIVWGTSGVSLEAEHGGPWPGFYIGKDSEVVHECDADPEAYYEYPVDRSDKWHLTGKPLGLMEDLVEIVPPGGFIVDLFAGSSTTLLAARRRGRRAIGCEISPHYRQVSIDRLTGRIGSNALAGQKSLFEGVV